MNSQPLQQSPHHRTCVVRPRFSKPTIALLAAMLVQSTVAVPALEAAVTELNPKSIIVLKGHPDAVRELSWLPDGNLLSGDWDCNLLLWDIAHGRKVRSFKPANGFVRSLGTFDQGRRFFACVNTEVVIGKVASGSKTVSIVPAGAVKYIDSARVSPDGKNLAVQVGGTAVRFYSTSTGKETAGPELPGDMAVAGIEFTPGGQFVVSCGTGSDLWVMDVPKPTPAITMLLGKSERIAVSPNGKMVVGVNNRALYLGELQAGTRGKNLLTNGGTLESMAWTPDSTRVATAGSSGLIEFWDPGTGKLMETLQLEPGQTSCVAFSPDGKWLAIGSGHFVDMDRAPPRQMTGDNSIRLLPVKFASSSNGAGALVAAAADVMARLQMLQQQFDAAKARTLGPDAERRIKDVKSRYVTSLDRQIAAAAQTVRLEEAVELKKEKEAVLADALLPPVQPDASQALKNARAGYEQQAGVIEQAQRTALQPLYERYEAALTAYMGELSRAQRVEDALSVKAARDAVAAKRSP